MNCWHRRYGFGVVSPQYSLLYHLNRSVRCVDCQAPLHKTHETVVSGHRCLACYEAWLSTQQRMASH
jgi:hypothetical protein